MSLKSERSRAQNQSKRKTTPLGIEQLEARMMNAFSGIEQNLELLLAPNLTGSTQIVSGPVNGAPTVANAVRLANGTEVRGTSTSASVLGADDQGEANLIYTWQAITTPAGATVQFANNASNAAKLNTLSFSKAGAYVLRVNIQDQNGLTTSSRLSFNVVQTLTDLRLSTPDGSTVDPAQPLTVGSTSQRLTVRGIDQFGATMTPSQRVTWIRVSGPSGGSFNSSMNSDTSTLTFNKTGTFEIRAQSGTLTSNFSVNVVPTFTSITLRNSENKVIATNAPLVGTAKSQLWTATAIDQFGAVLAQQPTIDWTLVTSPNGAAPISEASGNALSTTFDKAGVYAFRAKSGTIATQLSLNITSVLSSIQLQQQNGDGVNSTDAVSVVGTNLKLRVRGYDQFGNPLAQLPSLTWGTTKIPTGGTASGSLASGIATINFTRAGSYTLFVRGVSATTSFQVNVAQSLTSIVPLGTDNRVISTAGLITTDATSVTLKARGLDQFGQPMTTQPTFQWAVESSPTGADATISETSSGMVIAFAQAGRYTTSIAVGSLKLNINFNVAQKARSLSVSPGTVNLDTGAKQLFVGQVLDQFQQPIKNAIVTWSAAGGSISTAGLFSAPSKAGTFTVTARFGSLSASVSGSISAATPTPTPTPTPSPQGGISDTSLRNLINSLYGDSSLSRTEMMQILRSAGSDGTVTQTELADLQYLVSPSSTYAMPSYVRVLAKDVVSDNPANRMFQGVAAGNLVAGSSGALLNKLVDKWFLGADAPSIAGTSYTYQTSVGNLFNGSPSRADTFQGSLGDCYFISAIAAIADRYADAIRNMFIDNGDNTYTIRFYAGAASGATAVADYVTVDRKLPATRSGALGFSGYGQSVSNASTTLWIALAEKAYAQWNETGKEGRNGTNTYSGIEGGWMANVNAQVLGYGSTNYSTSTASKQSLIDALNAGRAVTIGTNSNASAGGLYGSHAYIVTGYNAASDTFSLHNPWGFSHPSALTWDQIRSNCSAFSVTDPSNSTAINMASVRNSLSENLVGNWTTIVSAGIPSDGNRIPSTTQVETYNAMSNIDKLSLEIDQVTHEWVTLEEVDSQDFTSNEAQTLEDLHALAVDLAMSMEHLDSILSSN